MSIFYNFAYLQIIMRWNSSNKNTNKFARLNILIGLLLWLGAFDVTFAIEPSNNILPCDYADSLDLTGGVLLPDKSQLFRGVRYPADHWAKINYTIFDGKIIPRDPYIRGCVCNVKKCIRMCCPYGSYLEIKNGAGLCRRHEVARHIDGDIINQNNQTERIKYHEHFAILHRYPCDNIHMPGENYSITHEGNAVVKNQTLNQHEYCLMASMNDATKSIDLHLAICTDAPDGEFDVIELDLKSTIGRILLPICMLLSVLFIIATLIVYGFVPKIRHLNEKCLMCYLVILGSTFTMVSVTQLTGYGFVWDSPFCFIIPYAIYFAFLSIFLWLNVINFDLWLSFQPANNFKKLPEHVQFFWYLMYGYGIPSLSTFIIYILDEIEAVPEYLQPGFDASSCSFHGWIQEILFFFIPASIILPMNVVFFVLTLKRIQLIQHEAKRMEEGTLQETNSKLQTFLNKKKTKCLLYFKLFIVTGVSWIAELFMLFIHSDIFFYTDLFNSLQGVYVFIIFVMNRRVIRLAKERWNAFRGIANANEHEDSISTTNDADNYLRLNATTPAN